MASGKKETQPSRPDATPKTFADILENPKPLDAFERQKKSQTNDNNTDEAELKRFQGSLIGLAVGDALGASVEFRPNDYMCKNPVKDMAGGGTWGLDAGKWTDDTTMTLCLATSLIVKKGFNAQDQFVRYRKWLKDGYLSSTDSCFDIGKATREAIQKFIEYEEKHPSSRSADGYSEEKLYFGPDDAAGNGSLMRIAPIPLFFYHSTVRKVLDYSKRATKMTHGDIRAIEVSQYFAYLVFHAVRGGISKEDLLDGRKFLEEFRQELQPEVKEVVLGSYKKKERGYEDGIRGQGFVVKALEAALWAFYTDGDNFEIGALKAVNLGDDTDTTAAIYGQLAGAFYGLEKIPERWRRQLYQYDFIERMATELFYVGRLNANKNQESNWNSKSDDSNKKGPQGSNKNKK